MARLIKVKVKVKLKGRFTPEQGTKTHSFLNLGARREWVINATPERPGAHCIGSWLGPVWRVWKSRPNRVSIP